MNLTENCIANEAGKPNNGLEQNRPQRIILLGAGFSTRNMGVWALASGAISSALHSFPDCNLQLFDYNRTAQEYTVRHANGTSKIELVNIRFSKKFYLPNNIAKLIFIALLLRLLPFRGLRERIIRNNTSLHALARADIIGSIAGGDSFSDIYGIGRLFYVSFPQILVVLMGKRLVLLPQTLGPFKSALSKRIASYILGRAEIVYARDHQSLEMVRNLAKAPPSRFRCSYDMAFALEPIRPSSDKLVGIEEIPRTRPLVGFNVSGLLYMGGYDQRNMFDLKPDYPRLVREIIEYFISQNTEVLLVPHVFGESSKSESDVIALQKIYKELGPQCAQRLHLVNGSFDHQEIKYIIGRCDFFLGSRMHACIAALSQSIPTIGLAYSRKFDGVFRSIQVQELVLDLRGHDKDKLLVDIKNIYDNRKHFEKHLKSIMPHVRSTVLELFSSFLPKAVHKAKGTCPVI